MSAKYKSPSFLLPNELNTSANPLNTDGDPTTGTGINSLYSMDFDGNVSKRSINLGIISEINGLTSFSISLWINPYFGLPLESQLVFGNRDVSNSYRGVAFGLGIRASSTSNFYITSSTGTTAIPIPADAFTENAWNHTVFTYDGNTAIAYVNNVNVASSSVSGATLSSTAEFFIGRGFNATNLYAKGKIDEFAIFNRALNTTEIAALFGGSSPNIYPSNLMATNLKPVAYYPLGEQAQNSGYPSATGNEWQFPNGVLQDYVMDFDSTSPGDYISAPMTMLNSATQCTISFWGKKDASNKQLNVGGWESDSAGIWVNWYLDGNLYLTPRGTGATSFSVSYAQPYDNNWHHFLGVYDGSSAANCKLYLDGDLVATGSGTAPSSLPATTGDNFQIGALGTSYLSDGQISNVAVWNTAITDANQIANIYNNGSPQTTYTVTPQNWWKLNATSVYTPSAPNYTTALDFGGSQTVDTNYTGLDGLSKATISLWVKPDVASASAWIFNARDASNVGMNCQFYTSKTYLYFTLGINIISDNFTSTFDDNLWVNLVIVFDGTLTGNDRIKLYANGKTKVIQTYNGTIPAVLPTSSTSLELAQYLDGQLSNFAIFNSALTSSQVSTLFNFGTPETAISLSPQAWWKLNDQTAITDSSGNGNTGTNNGATDISSGVAVTPSWKIPDASGTSNGVSTTLPSTALQQSDLQFDSPYSNYSLSFDGIGNYIDCTNDSILTPTSAISISLWVKTNDSTNFASLIDKWINTNTGYMIHLSTSANQGKPMFQIGATVISSSVIVNDGDWHHVSVTCDNTTGYIYVDGVQTGTGSLTMTGISSLDNLKIGGDGSSGPYLNGKIDETAIWNTALTNAQILEIYNNGRPKDLTTFSGTAPISWWRLGENAYFNNNVFTVPNSITGAPNGTGSGTVTSMISADAPGTYANGIGTNLAILDRVGDAALSTSNSQSYNMIPSDISPYVPQYVGKQIANAASMTFGGVDEYFNTGSSTIGQLQVMSVSAWFKETQNAVANTALVANNGSTDKGWIIWIDGTNMRWQVADGSNTSWNNTIVGSFRTYAPLGNWNHVCCTFDGVDSKIYINGILRETWTATPTPYVVDYSGNVGNLTIGRRSYANSGFFRGQIDEVALFNYALNAGQIYNDIYLPTKSGTGLTANLDNNPNLTAPVAWYRMGD